MSDYSQILEREKKISSTIKTLEDKKIDTKRDDTSSVFVSKIKKEEIQTKNNTFSFASKKNETNKNKFNSINPPIAPKQSEVEETTLWVSLSEAANMGGVQTKTLRRAIKSDKLKYKIIHNRYLVDFSSLMKLLLSNRKLSNKLKESGIGQYVKEWKPFN